MIITLSPAGRKKEEKNEPEKGKPCAAAACVILKMVDDCQEKIIDISFGI